jgi:hypothetical protein
MRRHLFLLTLGLLIASCGDEAPLPTPDGESALVIVTYPSGWVDTMDVTGITTSLIAEPAGADTTHCLRIQVEGVPAPTPGEGEDPVVDIAELYACGPAFQVPPLNWTKAFTDGAEVQSLTRAATVGYQADSGSATIHRLGGGYVQTTYQFRYPPVGSDLPARYRVAAEVVAQWQGEAAD